MNTDLLLEYYQSIGHENFRNEVIGNKLPPEIQEIFDEITRRVKTLSKLDNFPILFFIKET